MNNNNISEIKEVLLYFVNFRIDLNLFIKLRERSKVKLAIIIFKRLKEIYKEIKN